MYTGRYAYLGERKYYAAGSPAGTVVTTGDNEQHAALKIKDYLKHIDFKYDKMDVRELARRTKKISATELDKERRATLEAQGYVIVEGIEEWEEWDWQVWKDIVENLEGLIRTTSTGVSHRGSELPDESKTLKAVNEHLKAALKAIPRQVVVYTK